MILNSIFSISSVKDAPMAWAFGSNNELITRNSTDMQHFKALTTGHTLIMGRKTFESLGSKALPNRKMIVISNMDVSDFEVQENCFLARSLDEAIHTAETEGAEQAFVIGGANLIREAMMKCDNIYYTIFNTNIKSSDEYVYLNMSMITQTKLFSTAKVQDFRETCNVLGEDKMIRFKMVQLARTAVLNQKRDLQAAEKKALKADRKARKMARKLYARTKREIEAVA